MSTKVPWRDRLGYIIRRQLPRYIYIYNFSDTMRTSQLGQGNISRLSPVRYVKNVRLAPSFLPSFLSFRQYNPAVHHPLYTPTYLVYPSYPRLPSPPSPHSSHGTHTALRHVRRLPRTNASPNLLRCLASRDPAVIAVSCEGRPPHFTLHYIIDYLD